MTAIDYYFSPISPWTYLGHRRLGEIAARHGAAIRMKPVDLGRVFAASGGLPLAKRPPQRQAYRLAELARWSARLNAPLNPQPRHFPRPDALVSHMIIAAGPGAAAFGFAFGVMRAVWAEERDIADPATLTAIAEAEGLDGHALVEAAAAPEIAARRDAHTDEAIAAGVFGSPSYVVDGELFWGQDRLDFVDEMLAGR